jgi:glycosyltransferase involved in cell wall biosynthesis
MLVLQVFRWLLLAGEVCILGPILYLCVLSVSAVLNARRYEEAHRKSSAEEVYSYANFVILIPAHNEEVILGILLENLTQLAYPEDRYTICVVADNCTDRTAELARGYENVRVYERFNEDKRGKGYALNWLMQKLEEEQMSYDAYVVLDADSVVVPTFLHSMNRELTKGARAMQGSNAVLNISDSPSTALRWLALTLMNHVRPLGRNGIGASSTLTGNGMCLSRSLLLLYPWRAFSLSEDYQYYLTLVKHGERVRYVPDAVVRSQMPTTFAQMRTQDVRWESSGGGQRPWRLAGELLREGLKYHDFIRIEAFVELVTPPLSLIVCWCLLTVFASVLVWSPVDLLISLILMCGLIYYIGTALLLLRPPRKVYMAFLHAPGFMLWKLWVYFVLKKSKKHTSAWVRTSRVG